VARIRTIKPDFWTDGNMIGLSFAARLFYIGTWNFSLCDGGHLPDDAVGLKLKILPADAVDAVAIVDELLAAGRLLRRRSTAGRSYLYNPRLGEHQKTDARWQSRCPHCASEADGGYVEEAVSLPEPHRDSPEPAESLGNSAMGSKGREGKVKESKQHAPRAVADASAATAAEPLSVTQRSRRITDAYAQAEPMCKWPAVNGVVIKAIHTEKWADDEIQSALLRLAAEGRSVTVESLRVELNGLPPPNGRASPRLTEHNGLMLNDRTIADLERTQRLAALDEKRALEGPAP
jgi:hypothetical protein